MATAEERFGGGYSWTLGKDQDGKPTVILDIGDAITFEGPGEGYTIAPWVLDRYERVLRLRPGPAWLLKRLIKYAWDFKKPVYPSLHQMEKEAVVTRRSLQNWMRELEDLGYAIPVGSEELGKARHYDVSGIFSALALCIAADPSSAWAKRNKALTPDEVRGLCHCGPGDRAVQFNLDFVALEALCGEKL